MPSRPGCRLSRSAVDGVAIRHPLLFRTFEGKFAHGPLPSLLAQDFGVRRHGSLDDETGPTIAAPLPLRALPCFLAAVPKPLLHRAGRVCGPRPKPASISTSFQRTTAPWAMSFFQLQPGAPGPIGNAPAARLAAAGISFAPYRVATFAGPAFRPARRFALGDGGRRRREKPCGCPVGSPPPAPRTGSRCSAPVRSNDTACTSPHSARRRRSSSRIA